MTNERAIQIIHDVIYRLTGDPQVCTEDEYYEALWIAHDALRGPRWIKASEQIPEKSEQAVLALTRANGKWHLRITEGGHVRGWPEECHYWMPLPLPPEETP